MLTAIVGINWGDEGKGRMVDLLSRDYKTIVRYQGGNFIGSVNHTIIWSEFLKHHIHICLAAVH